MLDTSLRDRLLLAQELRDPRMPAHKLLFLEALLGREPEMRVPQPHMLPVPALDWPRDLFA